MSVNKNALIRYKVLDSCFRNHAKKYFIEDLIDECSNVLAELNPSTNGISRRQIFQDIQFMESTEGWNIELEKNRKKRSTERGCQTLATLLLFLCEQARLRAR